MRRGRAWAERIAGLSGWRADATAFLCGVLAACGLPPVHAVPLLAVVVPALLCQIAGAGSLAVAARRGWWFGFGLYLAGLYWVTEPILIEAAAFWWLVPFAAPGLAAVLAVFVAAPAALAWLARPGWRRVFTLAGAWVAADLARQFVATGFPWNLLGSVWELPGWPGDVMIQLASVVGLHGMTLLTLLLAAVPLLSWTWRGIGVALLAAWIGFGWHRLDQPMPKPPGTDVLLIQGNVAQGQKWDRALLNAIFGRYLALTRQAVATIGDHRGIVVWPETASPALLQADQPARSAIAEAAGGHPALVGAVRFGPDDRPRNSLFALGPDGAISGIYDKWHLVPFGEYQPGWLRIGIQVVPGGGFTSGPGPRTIHAAGLPPVGVLICYEAIFPSQVIDEADRPSWMVNVTNDAWFGDSSGPRQHLAATRMRAVEEGLPLLRAANTGISAGFDARGHELGRLGLRRTGFLAIPLPPALPRPVYARCGLLLPGGLALLAMFTGLADNPMRRKRISVKKDTDPNPDTSCGKNLSV